MTAHCICLTNGAYQNGSLLALDINETSREDSLESCIEMLAYCTYVTIGVTKNGVRIQPMTDVTSAYVKLATRLADLLASYSTQLSRGMQARINSYVGLLYGTDVEAELVANNMQLNQFLFDE